MLRDVRDTQVGVALHTAVVGLQLGGQDLDQRALAGACAWAGGGRGVWARLRLQSHALTHAHKVLVSVPYPAPVPG